MFKEFVRLFGVFALIACTSCFKKESSLQSSGMRVTETDQSFSVDTVITEPGGEVSFELYNGFKDQSLKFMLLKTGEDPILVQHLKAQQGSIPTDYYLFKSKSIKPNEKIKIEFKAPSVEGEYAYVGVSDAPRETLIGRLIVKKKKVKSASRSSDI